MGRCDTIMAMIRRRKRSKKDVISSERSCVNLHDSVSMSLQNVRPVPRNLLRCALALLGVCSTFAVFFGYFPLPVNEGQFYLAAVLATLVFSFFLRKQRSAVWLYVLLPVALLLCCVPLWDELHYGMEKAVGFVQAVIDDKQFILGRPGWKITWSAQQCLQYAVTLCGVCISFLVCLFTVRRPRFIPVFLLLMGFVELGLFHGKRTSSPAVFCWIAYMVAMIILTDGNESFGRQKNNKYVFFYVEHTLFAKPGMRFMPTECIGWVAAAAVILLGGVGCALTQNEARTRAAHEIRMEIREKWNGFMDRLSSVGEGGSPFEPGPMDSAEEITLAERNNPKFNNKTVFSFSMQSPTEAETMYLKANTHSVYTGSAWLPLPEATYTLWLDLFNSMKSGQSMPQAPIRDAGYSSATITYPNSRSAAQKYLPYQAVWDPTARYRYDTDMLLDRNDHQTYTFDPEYLFQDHEILERFSHPTTDAMEYYDQVTHSPLIVNEWKQYDSFVRVNYLQVPYSDAMTAIRDDAAEVLNRSYNNTAEALQAIRTYLHSKAVYSLEPEIVRDDRDFASYFLLEGGEGYCVHFATAGVLLCRMLQIPARYASGYVIFTEDFEDSLQQISGYTYYYNVNVQDSRAHAWAEIYLPGFGWMPYEFTAGYTESDNAQAVRPQTTDGSTSSTTTTTTAGSDVSWTGTTAQSSSGTESVILTTDGEGQSSGGGSLKTVVQVILCVILSMAAIAVLMVLYVVIHRVIHEALEGRMTQNDPNRGAEESYRFLLRLLAAEGIHRHPQQSHEEFAVMAETLCKAIPAGAMEHTVETQLALTFSPQGVTKEQAEEQAAFVRELTRRLYQQASPFRRFVMRWVRHWIC